MFKYEKKYNGLLNIDENYVSIDTNHNYHMIELRYMDIINIYSSLPKSYVIKKGRSAIVIIKKESNTKIISRLFRYSGIAKIVSCKIYTDNNEFVLPINRSALQTWESFDRTLVQGSDDVLQVWEGLTRNYEDLEFDGWNNKRNYLYNYFDKDKEAKTITLVREIRKGRKSYG